DQYDVYVRAENKFRTDIEGLRRMIVPSSKIGYVTLDRVVTSQTGTGPASIDRVKRQRQVTLLANTKPGGPAVHITSAMVQPVTDTTAPAGSTAGNIARPQAMGEAGSYSMLAVVPSFACVDIVLAAPVASFSHPATILVTLPLSIPLGISSLMLTGQSVNIF